MSSARRVNTSMWRASSAAWIASSCITSRKCGCSWPRKRAGTSSAAVSFSIRYVITCTTASSTSSGSSNGASHGIAVVRIPLRAPRPARTARAASSAQTSRLSASGKPNVRARPPRRARRARPGPSGAADPRRRPRPRRLRRRASAPARSAPCQRSACASPGVIAGQAGRLRRQLAGDGPARGTRRAGARRSSGARLLTASRSPGATPRSARLIEQVGAASKPTVVEYRSLGVHTMRTPRASSKRAAIHRPLEQRVAARCGPGIHAFSPSRSSSGRTAASSYDIASSSSRKRSICSPGAPSSDREVAVVVRRRSARARACGRRAGCPRARTRRWLPSIMHAASTLAGEQRPHRVALAADVVAVLADRARRSAAPSKSLPGFRPWLAQRVQRDQRRLRRVGGADADALALAGRPRSAIVGVAAHDDHRGQVAIGVAHRDRLAPAGRGARPMRSVCEPRERRVPRDVDVAAKLRLDLALVVRVQHVVERQARGRRSTA